MRLVVCYLTFFFPSFWRLPDSALFLLVSLDFPPCSILPGIAKLACLLTNGNRTYSRHTEGNPTPHTNTETHTFTHAHVYTPPSPPETRILTGSSVLRSFPDISVMSVWVLTATTKIPFLPHVFHTYFSSSGTFI